MARKQSEFPMEIKDGSVVVKIYQTTNKGSTSYTLAYYVDGIRRLQAFADLDAAKAEAKNVAAKMAQGEIDILKLKGADRNVYLRALASVEPTCKPLDLAAAEFAEASKVLNGTTTVVEAAREYVRRHQGAVENKMVPDAVAEVLRLKEQQGASPHVMKVWRLYLNRFAEAFHCPLRSVTSSEVTDFINLMRSGPKKNKKQSVGPRTKNNVRQILGSFFNVCRQRGLVLKDHEGVSLIPKVKEPAGRIEIFTPDEISKLLKKARREMVPFLAIGAFAGLRNAEICRLDWKEVKLKRKFIEVPAAKAKTASRRIVPIQPNLKKWLKRHAKKDGAVVPFKNIAKQLSWLASDAGTRWKKNGLRHSFISYRLAEIHDTPKVALEAGTSPQMIFRHYRELVQPSDADAWFSIDPVRKKKRVGLGVLAKAA